MSDSIESGIGLLVGIGRSARCCNFHIRDDLRGVSGSILSS